MQVHRGKVHTYVGMTLNYEYLGEVRISMFKYVEEVIEAFKQAKLKFNDGFMEVRAKKRTRSSGQLTAAPKNLFVVKEECKKLEDSDRESFHSIVQKTLYVAKRAQPNVMPSISFLTKRVKQPDHDDWSKLEHMVQYLDNTLKLPLVLSADESDNLYWYADSAFAVHPNMRSHNGAGLTLGRGFAINISTMQKLNTGSSTHAEVVCASDMLPMSQWIHLFVLAQGLKVNKNISLLARVVAKILATKVRRFFFNRRTIPTVASTVCIEKPTYFSKKREREKKNSKKGGSKKTSPAKLIS